MVLVLFFLGLVTLICFLTATLSLQIDIKNFKFYKEENIKGKVDKNYEILIKVYIFKKVKIFKYKINSKKIRKNYLQNIQNKLDLSILKSFFSNNKEFTNINFCEIESLNLDLNLGTENVIATSGITSFSNILIPIFLSKVITCYDKEKYYYKVTPIYENKNKISLFLETKIRIKLYSLYKSLKSYTNARKKVRENKNYSKTIFKIPIQIVN